MINIPSLWEKQHRIRPGVVPPAQAEELQVTTEVTEEKPCFLQKVPLFHFLIVGK